MNSILSVTILLCGAADAEEAAVSREKRERFESILNSYELSRRQLQSGIYRAVGDKRDGTAQNERFPAYRGPVTIYSAFDYEARMLRFDRTEPGLWDNGPDKPLTGITLQLNFARTPKYSIYASAGWIKGVSGECLIRQPDVRPSAELAPINVRILGAAPWDLVREAGPLEATVDRLRHWRLADVTERQEGIVQVSLVPPKPADPAAPPPAEEFRWEVWFNTRQDCSPTRSELLMRDAAGRWQPQSVSTASWTQMEKVWVPETFTLHEQYTGQERLQTYDLRFAWESVNRPVPAELMTVEGIEPLLEDGTMILDERSRPTRVVRRVRR